MLRTVVVVMLTLSTSVAAPAQVRQSEEDLFGAETRDSSGDRAPGRPAEDDVFGETPAKAGPAPAALDNAPPAEDPLALGGMLYLRSFVSGREGVPVERLSLSLPAIVDGYFDARPNDRVRGFVLARMHYDAGASGGPVAGVGSGVGTSGGGGGGLAGLAATPANPRVVLDQLWIRFDVGRAVFVTAGKQHVKWGAARFWTPADFLHQVRRNPLSVFDERTGVTMLKLHLPWEARGWNFYALSAFDLDDPASELGGVVGGGRAEVVLGTAELGLVAVGRRAEKPLLGVDLSAGLGDLDVYLESALTTAERGRWRRGTGPCPFTLLTGCRRARDPYFAPSVTLGGDWSYRYSDEDSFTLGVEYFYNGVGHDDPAIYTTALVAGELTPFYAGRHYGAVFLLVPNPGSWNNTTFTLSTLANLSDRSLVSRLDYRVLVLTYLGLELFGAAHYGAAGGEFRFPVRVPPQRLGSEVRWDTTTNPPTPRTVDLYSPPIDVSAPVFEVGVALQVSL